MLLNVFAPDWTLAESYGRIARELSDHLEALGVEVNRVGINSPQRHLRPCFGGLLLAYPTNFYKFGSMASQGPRIAVTMFESTALPDGWVEVLNQMDAVIVPSRWLMDVFHNAGVTVPLHCVPLGVSSAYQYVERDHRARPYTFLALGDRGRRKGWHIAGFAFMRAFGEDPNYRLIFKTRPGSMMFALGNANMGIIEGEFSDEEMAALFEECDCFINPNAMEGFGLAPREFAATGGISIATNVGGTADDIAHWGLPIAVERWESAWAGEPKLEGLGQWAVPDVNDLAATMLHVARHRDFYAERGQVMAEYVRTRYSWRAFAEQVLAIWNKVYERRYSAA
jgi:glycosyltransferase involved in cell wall biosynthesis